MKIPFTYILNCGMFKAQAHKKILVLEVGKIVDLVFESAFDGDICKNLLSIMY